MKMMSSLIVLGLAVAVIIFGITAYLSPDGLKNCDVEPSDVADCVKADAIVAISGGDTVARTAAAIELYDHHWGGKLILSGAAADKSGPSNALAMKRQALKAGIPESVIILDETSETTKENADNSINIFKDNNIKSVILVTSAYHQRRAGLEFGQRAGMSVRIVNHPVRSDNQWDGWWWTRPSGWYLAVSELAKIVVFYAGASR